MSDMVQVAVITSSANILAIIISRVLSHFEHKAGMDQGTKTAQQVDEIHTAMNGSIK